MTSMCLRLLGGNLVQTGVVWGGARGILLDTETAECNMRRDSFFGGGVVWIKENRRERTQKEETADKCSFFWAREERRGEKKQQIFSRLK